MRQAGAWMLMAGVWVSGCAPSRVSYTALDRVNLRDRAVDYLRSAVTYRQNPAVRVGAIEALQRCESAEVLPWIRAALLDDEPAVRFAACVALGVRRDGAAEAGVRNCTMDSDPNVVVGALFALHQLGDERGMGRLATFLLEHPDTAVRRHAGLALGMTGESAAIAILARAMKDRDRGVRQHALEAMARLGNPEAIQELVFMSNSGVGSEEVFAIRALSASGDRRYEETYRYKLANAMHAETRLAAAEALGSLGDPSGYEMALGELAGRSALVVDVKDPPAGQRLRRVQLAASALGAIGRTEALPDLRELLESSRDPRVQVSAAGAMVAILEAERSRGLPFAADGHGPETRVAPREWGRDVRGATIEPLRPRGGGNQGRGAGF